MRSDLLQTLWVVHMLLRHLIEVLWAHPPPCAFRVWAANCSHVPADICRDAKAWPQPFGREPLRLTRCRGV